MKPANATIKSLGVDPTAYHAHGIKRGDKSYPVSSTMLREFARNPRKWLDGEPSESDAQAFGSLVDCLVLTPNQFASRYAVIPPDLDRRTKAGKDWIAAQAGKVCIPTDEHNAATRAAANLLSDLVLAEVFHGAQSQAWVEGEHTDEATGITVPVRCLIDLVPAYTGEHGTMLADLKTARDGSPLAFNRAVYSYGYHWQAAWNLDLWNAASDETRDGWLIVGCENSHPFAVFRRVLSREWIELGRQQVAEALALYCRCLATGQWPGYDDHDETQTGWTLCRPEPWMLDTKPATTAMPKW